MRKALLLIFAASMAFAAKPSDVEAWKKGCLEGKIAGDCYELGVYFSQDLQDEKDAVSYYKKACNSGHHLACFNLGGLLIKYVESRAEGTELFRKSCHASREIKMKSETKEKLAVACKFLPILDQNLKTDYQAFREQLSEISERTYTYVGKPLFRGKAAKRAFDEMNKSLDVRLLKLKDENKNQFKFEMKTQERFNLGVAAFCEEVRSACDGSACRSCPEGCYEAAFQYRRRHSEQTNQGKLEFVTAASGKVHPRAKMYFGDFVTSVCQLPTEAWKSGKISPHCQSDSLSEISSRLIETFISDEKNEGDVCAVIEN